MQIRQRFAKTHENRKKRPAFCTNLFRRREKREKRIPPPRKAPLRRRFQRKMFPPAPFFPSPQAPYFNRFFAAVNSVFSSFSQPQSFRFHRFFATVSAFLRHACRKFTFYPPRIPTNTYFVFQKNTTAISERYFALFAAKRPRPPLFTSKSAPVKVICSNKSHLLFNTTFFSTKKEKARSRAVYPSLRRKASSFFFLCRISARQSLRMRKPKKRQYHFFIRRFDNYSLHFVEF